MKALTSALIVLAIMVSACIRNKYTVQRDHLTRAQKLNKQGLQDVVFPAKTLHKGEDANVRFDAISHIQLPDRAPPIITTEDPSLGLEVAAISLMFIGPVWALTAGLNSCGVKESECIEEPVPHLRAGGAVFSVGLILYLWSLLSDADTAEETHPKSW